MISQNPQNILILAQYKNNKKNEKEMKKNEKAFNSLVLFAYI